MEFLKLQRDFEKGNRDKGGMRGSFEDFGLLCKRQRFREDVGNPEDFGRILQKETMT